MPYLTPCRKREGLLCLLAYAQRHAHSRFWVPAILVMLAREEVTHG
jgi:hypothetical protein